MQRIKLYAITALLLIAGPVFAVGSTVDYLHHRSLLESGRDTVAEVLDSSTRYKRRVGTVYTLVVGYETEQGVRQRSLDVPEETYQAALQTGRVDVRYDPADPDYVHEAGAAPAWWFPFVGLAMFAVGIRGGKMLRRERTAATQENGDRPGGADLLVPQPER